VLRLIRQLGIHLRTLARDVLREITGVVKMRLDDDVPLLVDIAIARTGANAVSGWRQIMVEHPGLAATLPPVGPAMKYTGAVLLPWMPPNIA
jgi:hypothetical protein